MRSADNDSGQGSGTGSGETVSPLPAQDVRAAGEAVLRSETGARQAFLLGLSDAVRPLLEPTAIQDVVARMLGEHLGAARVYYAQCDERAGTLTIHRDFVRDVGPSIRGAYSMEGTPAMVLDLLRSGRPCRLDVLAQIFAEKAFLIGNLAGARYPAG